MKRLEKILGIIVLVGLILKFTLLPGGNILFLLSLTILACLYCPLGFALLNQISFKRILEKDSYKGLSALRIIGAIGTGISLSTICIGVLFKLLHWPGSTLYLIAGLVTILTVFIIALLKYIRTHADYYIRITKRIAIIGGFGLVLAILSDLTIVKLQFRNHPDYVYAYEQYLNDPKSDELNERLDYEYHRATMSEKDFEIYLKHYKKQ